MSRREDRSHIPPVNEEAELSVLGSIIIDPPRIEEIAERLTVDDFYVSHCRTIYGEMLAMRREGLPIDWFLLLNRLENAGAEVTRTQIAELADSVPTATNAVYYANIVRLKAEQRRTQTTGFRLVVLASDDLRADQDYEGWRREIEETPQRVFTSNDGRGGVDHGWMNFADFMAQDARQNYLVQGIVPEAQGGIVSGRFKTLKTSITLDLFISMATGTPFLGRFDVPAPVPCGLMTSEAGAATIIGTAKRIAAAKGIDYRDGPHLTTLRAKMTDPRHLERVERDIVKHKWKAVGIDPTYLAFADVGDGAGNVFTMGRALEPITSLIQRTGCSIILLNHNIKGRGKDIGRFDPPDLAEISMSGFAEWMRFWLLLAPIREWDETTGTHSLWMKTGGSAGHAALHGLEVVEGEHDGQGRRTKWQVTLKDVSETRREKEKLAADRRAEQRERAENDHERRLLDTLRQCPSGETPRQLSDLSGLNKGSLATALRSLLKAGKIEQCTVTKRSHAYDGYRMATAVGRGGTPGQGGTNGGTVPAVKEAGQAGHGTIYNSPVSRPVSRLSPINGNHDGAATSCPANA